MLSILVLSDSDLSRDPRVRRQLTALAEVYQVTVLGRGELGIPGIRQIRYECDVVNTIGNPALRIILAIVNGSYAIRVFNRFSKRLREIIPWFPRIKRRGLFTRSFIDAARQAARALKPELIIANDHTALRAGVEAKRSAGQATKLLYDAHEYTPGQFADGDESIVKVEAIRTRLKTFLPSCDAMSTVCEGIAERYTREFGVPKPTVIVNACGFRSDLSPTPIQDDVVRLVHHGLAVRRRSLETMIEATRILGKGYSLDLYLVPSSREYLDELSVLAQRTPNVFLRAPVSIDMLPETLNRYDIGVYSLNPVNLNQELALPNKLFEFIQARLAVAIGPSPEMRKVVEGNGLGVVARDFSAEALAEVIGALSRLDIKSYKTQSHSVASMLSFEGQAEVLRNLVDSLIRTARV